MLVRVLKFVLPVALILLVHNRTFQRVNKNDLNESQQKASENSMVKTTQSHILLPDTSEEDVSINEDTSETGEVR